MANTFEAAFDNLVSSDAEFQALVQNFESAILASGFLELAPDTGQLNPLTVARPAAITTSAGYRVYRAKDSLAATKPLYVKIEFLTMGVLDRINIKRTLGTGSNGAGTMTGVVAAVADIIAPAGAGSGSAIILGGGGPHCAMVVSKDTGTANHDFWFMVGRLIDQADASATDSIMWDSFASGAGVFMGANMRWTDGASAWATHTSGMNSYFPDLGTTPVLHNGGDINTTRLYQSLVYRNAKTLVFPFVTGRLSELPFTNAAGSKFSLNIWGGSHTFLPLPHGALAGSASQRICMLWE